jgi:hypothetical protein
MLATAFALEQAGATADEGRGSTGIVFIRLRKDYPVRAYIGWASRPEISAKMGAELPRRCSSFEIFP